MNSLFFLGCIVLISYIAILIILIKLQHKFSTIDLYTDLDEMKDEFLVELFLAHFRETNIPQLIKISFGTAAFENHIENAHQQFLYTGTLPNRVRTYIIEVLQGKIPFEQILLA